MSLALIGVTEPAYDKPVFPGVTWVLIPSHNHLSAGPCIQLAGKLEAIPVLLVLVVCAHAIPVVSPLLQPYSVRFATDQYFLQYSSIDSFSSHVGRGSRSQLVDGDFIPSLLASSEPDNIAVLSLRHIKDQSIINPVGGCS